MKNYIQNGGDINTIDKCWDCLKDETPLELASRLGNLEIVKLLIENDAKLGGDELLWAIGYGYTDIAKFLIINGAKINDENNIVSNSAFEALCHKEVEVTELLLAKGAKIPPEVATIIILKPVNTNSTSEMFYVCLYNTDKINIIKKSRKSKPDKTDNSTSYTL